MLAPLVLLLVLPGADKDDAEKLFRQMETKLAKAKTVDCAYEARFEADKAEAVTMKGTLLLGEGNKLRMEWSGESGGMKEKFTMISDGTKMEPYGDDIPKWLGEAVRASMARAGVVRTFEYGSPLFFKWSFPRPPEPKKEFKIDEHFKVFDFKLGKKEMVDKQEAQVVQYTLKEKGTLELKEPKEGKVEVSVWIDTKTLLPLKRIITIMMDDMDDKKATYTETYTRQEVDGKIDPKQFELPKK
jgi:outer membrane lipoprotein-sorting protein